MTMQSNIRRQMRLQRQSLSQSYIEYYQPLFDAQLLLFIQKFSSVAAYSAVQNEISVNCLFDPLACHQIALPKINDYDELTFVGYENPALWQEGKYNILEPTTKMIDFMPELFIVPLTAIDRVGTRVGMGKGYYDRYLESVVNEAVFVGVGWDFQLIDHCLDRQPHDIPMDYFISPSHMIKF